MRVHLFGGASSPSCANFALKKTTEDNKADFGHETVETVKRNFYVDDCLKSVASDNAIIRLTGQLRELLSRGGFKLTKWLSNSRKVIESVPESERAALVKNLDFDQLPVERALGVQWNLSSDKVGFMHRWQSWLQELPKLEQLEIDRCFKSADLGEISSSQLNHFSDASQQGYGSVTYLRITDNHGNVKCSFVMGKSRLAPLKPVTIPRMELSEAVIATRLDSISQKRVKPSNRSFIVLD